MAYLVLLGDGQSTIRFMLEKKRISIGRALDNDIYLDDLSVSHEHAIIEVDKRVGSELVYRLLDNNSTNGTYVNNEKIEQATLKHNDLLLIGLSSLKFVDEQLAALEQTQQIKKSWFPGVYYLNDR